MRLDFSIEQEIFLVVFSILYGVMLQSIPGGAFPLGRTRVGWVKKYGYKDDNPKKIIHWQNRSILSIIFLNILPAIYMWIILTLLSHIPMPISELNNKLGIIPIFQPMWWCQSLYFLFVFWFAVGVFGFYRLYYVVVIYTRRSVFFDMKVFDERELSYDVWSHLIWLFVYVFLGPIIFWLLSFIRIF